jgi:hypothetical protein
MSINSALSGRWPMLTVSFTFLTHEL